MIPLRYPVIVHSSHIYLINIINMDKSSEYDSPNRNLYGPGVKANHSSESASLDSDLDHSQSDEAEENLPASIDPNLSGTTPTETPYTWLAGSMDGWCENDDYREYFEKSRGCDGMLACDPADGDYDDNGGVPTATGHSRGMHGSRDVSSAYHIATVITRRI